MEKNFDQADFAHKKKNFFVLLNFLEYRWCSWSLDRPWNPRCRNRCRKLLVRTEEPEKEALYFQLYLLFFFFLQESEWTTGKSFRYCEWCKDCLCGYWSRNRYSIRSCSMWRKTTYFFLLFSFFLWWITLCSILEQFVMWSTKCTRRSTTPALASISTPTEVRQPEECPLLFPASFLVSTLLVTNCLSAYLCAGEPSSLYTAEIAAIDEWAYRHPDMLLVRSAGDDSDIFRGTYSTISSQVITNEGSYFNLYLGSLKYVFLVFLKGFVEELACSWCISDLRWRIPSKLP